MKKMKTYIQLLLVVLFLPVLSACDQEDDVIDIFTGKTWYMTYTVSYTHLTLPTTPYV